MRATLLLAVSILSVGPGFSAPVMKCTELKSTSFGSDVTIKSATTVAATPQAPEYCDVRGTIWPEDNFAIALPTAWNNRFNMVGNGGSAGVISFGPMQVGLRRGFATASTDTGHDDKKEPGASFGERSPNNPNWQRKVDDFAFLATHETAVLAKKVIKTYYGQMPNHSYWVGCSTGGRQGLIEAQRYPEDFDGLVVGATVLNHTGTLIRHLWNAQAVQEGPGKISVEKLPALAKAVYGKCDAIDGLQDGLIENPMLCNFDPTKDLPKCAAGKDEPSCFTDAQAAALKKVYGGVRNSSGKLIFPGQTVGAEIQTPSGRTGWTNNVVGDSAGLKLAETYIRYIGFEPPPGPTWSYKDFNFDTDPTKLEAFGKKVNATNTDLTPLQKRGGKIIHYHGWADPMVASLMSVDYYESVVKRYGKKQADDFYRFFPIPGMFHCSGGPGCGNVDWLTPIVDWVEKGAAPEKLIGSHMEGGKVTRTRPLCPFPQMAKYNGSGSIDEAANFSCVAPPAKHAAAD